MSKESKSPPPPLFVKWMGPDGSFHFMATNRASELKPDIFDLEDDKIDRIKERLRIKKEIRKKKIEKEIRAIQRAERREKRRAEEIGNPSTSSSSQPIYSTLESSSSSSRKRSRPFQEINDRSKSARIPNDKDDGDDEEAQPMGTWEFLKSMFSN